MRVRNGNVLNVRNRKRQPTAAERYIALWVEDKSGRNERCIMMTIREYDSLPRCELPFRMVLGRLYPCVIGGQSFFAVVVNDGKKHCLRLSPAKLKSYESRAKINIEDIPKKSLLADLLD